MKVKTEIDDLTAVCVEGSVDALKREEVDKAGDDTEKVRICILIKHLHSPDVPSNSLLG